MPKQVSFRNIPPAIDEWLQNEKARGTHTQQELILNALDEARKRRQRDRTLFDDEPHPVVDVNYQLPFKFIDLCAGIGGMRLGLSAVGGECVFSCEIDRYARKTYEAWYGESNIGEDVTKLNYEKIPSHDLLAAGFPCQPFSLAGVSKKNSLGRSHGFLDKAQGTLFFHIARIIESSRPPIVLLENVKNLKSHNKGDTWSTIKGHLEELNYCVFSKIIDAADYVPQHRERIFIVCFDKAIFGSEPPFTFPEPPNGPRPKLSSILEKRPAAKYTLTDNLWKYLQAYAEKHRKKGNGFGFGIADRQGQTRTLSARYYKDGSEILIHQNRKNPRRLTPTECRTLMGFPSHLEIQVSDMQAYKQFGNAVVPKVVEHVATSIMKVVQWQILRKNKHGCLLK